MNIVKSIYAIRHKESGEFVEMNGKSCWKSQGAAKLSFWQISRYKDERSKFDEQDEFEVVDIMGSYYALLESMEQAYSLNNHLMAELCSDDIAFTFVK